MQYLIDTHILIWLSQQSSRLNETTLTALRRAYPNVYVSIASLWEIAIKLNIKKLSLDQPIEKMLPEGFQLLSISPVQLTEYVTLPHHHRDPFDRLLIAQARQQKLTLVTQDAVFAKYDVKVMLV